jgi:hypothetical protein
MFKHGIIYNKIKGNKSAVGLIMELNGLQLHSCIWKQKLMFKKQKTLFKDRIENKKIRIRSLK